MEAGSNKEMISQHYVPIDLRFWQKVKFGQGMDDCWEWTGFCCPSGHGQFHMGKMDTKASRAAWILYNGPLRREEYVCHRCHNPKCVRLDHLYLGTHASNQKDEAVRGSRKNEKGHNAKLNWDQVSYIRQSKGTESQNSLAHFFEVSQTTISRIFRGAERGGWREGVALNG